MYMYLWFDVFCWFFNVLECLHSALVVDPFVG